MGCLLGKRVEKMKARRTRVYIKIEGKDITKTLEDYLTGFSYTDNEEEAADDLQINLEDKAGHWLSDWLSKAGKGLKVEAKILQEEAGKTRPLPCGIFEIDNISSTGPPDKVTLKAISLPTSGSLSGEEKSKAWEKAKLSSIAGEIAKANKMGFFFDSSYDPRYDRKEQQKQTDIAFLQDLCKEAGINLKITAQKIVMFDASKYEKMKPVATFTKGSSDIFGYKFATNLKDTGYSSCEVSYTDSKTKKTIKGKFDNPDKGKVKKVLKINTKVNSTQEANELAKKNLREKNKKETTAGLEVLGNIKYVAGNTVEVKGWGLYDGKYIIETAAHSVGNGGYTTSLTLRKVLKGY